MRRGDRRLALGLVCLAALLLASLPAASLPPASRLPGGPPFKLLLPLAHNGANHPPDPPRLLAPLDGASGQVPDPLLRLAVSDPDGGPLQVSVYGKGAGFAAPFTIAVLPDTQHYSETYPETFTAQTRWIAAQRQARSIVFVTHVGDVTNQGDRAPGQWGNAGRALYILDAAQPEIPYGIAIGNHDMRGGTLQYNTWFGVSHFQDNSYYGGHYGADNNHHYELFSAGGMEFILLHLGYNPDPAVLEWAGQVLGAHAQRRAIVTSHSVLNLDGSWTAPGAAIYQALKGSPNLFLILCGHNHGEARRQDTFNGRTVYSLLADYQDEPNGGDGWLRLLEFTPAQDRVQVRSYSPTLDRYRLGAASQFSFPYDMPDPQEYHLVARQAGVPSGTSLSLAWSGLQPLSTYTWFAVVQDAESTTPGPVWSFTTRPLSPVP